MSIIVKFLFYRGPLDIGDSSVTTTFDYIAGPFNKYTQAKFKNWDPNYN